MMPFDQNFFGGNFESLLVAAAVAVARVVNVDLYREKKGEIINNRGNIRFNTGCFSDSDFTKFLLLLLSRK